MTYYADFHVNRYISLTVCHSSDHTFSPFQMYLVPYCHLMIIIVHCGYNELAQTENFCISAFFYYITHVNSVRKPVQENDETAQLASQISFNLSDKARVSQ